MGSDLIIYVAAALGFVAIVGVGFTFAGNGGQSASKRVKAIGEGAKGRPDPAIAAKRKQMADTMRGLREREEATRKNRAVGKSIEERIKQAGWSFPVSYFWIGSALMSVGVGLGVYIAGFGYPAAAGGAIAAGLGLPRWVLGMAISARQKKFSSQFADALDVIVRGVKSGLPLNECLKIIASESPQPLAREFEVLVDSLAMGAQLDQGLTKMFQRMPTQEVNFFAIVLGIQAKAGGNLSEALGNLSAVLRSRKLLREKIKALSSEAKASAMIIGSLPIIVMVLVYLTTPDYIMVLFVEDLGHLILLIAAGLMGTGIYIMRQMINFDF